MYYPCSKNKGADQLRSYCEADLHLCFWVDADCWFSHAAAQVEEKTKKVCKIHILHICKILRHFR